MRKTGFLLCVAVALLLSASSEANALEQFRVNDVAESVATLDYANVATNSLTNKSLIVWIAKDSAVMGQQFNENFEPIGSNFRIDNGSTGMVKYPSAAAMGNGWAVAWWNYDEMFNQRNIYLQFYNEDCNALGERKQVNDTDGNGRSTQPRVAGYANGCAVTWLYKHSIFDGDDADVLVQFYDENRNPIGQNLRVNDDDGPHGYECSAINFSQSGKAIVAWDKGGLMTGCEIYAQRLDASGRKVGDNFLVSDNGMPRHIRPEIGRDSDNGHIIFWFAPTAGVFYQEYSRDGIRIGPNKFLEFSGCGSNLRVSFCRKDYVLVSSIKDSVASVGFQYGLNSRQPSIIINNAILPTITVTRSKVIVVYNQYMAGDNLMACIVEGSSFVEPQLVEPYSHELHQNYPNPFNPVTTIDFTIKKAGKAKVTVYNMLGQPVAILVNGHYQAGPHTVAWYAANMASGVYFYRLEAGDFTMTKKMMLVR